MAKSNVKVAPKSNVHRAKTLTRSASTQSRAAADLEAKRAKWREDYYRRNGRPNPDAQRTAPVAQVAASVPVPVQTVQPSITKAQLVSTLEVQLVAARTQPAGEAREARISALETSLLLARLLA